MNQHVNDFTELLQEYKNNLKGYKALSKEDEFELFKQYKSGSLAARDKIIKANLKFAFSVAKKYSGRGVAMEDLVSEANLGLLHAIDKYDPSLGYKFFSYAVWWIKRYVMESVNKKSNMMKDENVLDEDVNTKKCGPLADPEDERVTLVEACMEDVTEDEELEEMENKRMTVSLMKALDKKETHVIKKLYGMDGSSEAPLRELSKEMGISIERVRQIKKSAIGKMRISAMTDSSKYARFFS